MKLLLTSTGLSEAHIRQFFLNELGKNPDQSSVLMVAYPLNEEEKFYINKSKKEIEDLSFKKFMFVDLHKDFEIDEKNFDVVYVCGGNTFSILDQIRKKDLDLTIINLVNKGAFYVGVSAGSILAGPDISIAGWDESWDRNLVGLQDTRGFNMVDFAISPHFREDKRSVLLSNLNKINYKIIPITDNQAVFVKDNVQQVVGEGDEIQL